MALHCAGQGNVKICLNESKIQTLGKFEISAVHVLLSDHNEGCAFVLSVRPSRDSAVNRNVTVIKETYFREPGARGVTVVEALRYKLEGRGIDSQWCKWNFSLT
jgi:hypothetical protein